MICDECKALYEDVGDYAREAKVFQKVRRTDDALICRAIHVDSDTSYRVEVGENHDIVFIGLYTPDRWLSESIEADLMIKQDKIEELLEDELYDQGFEVTLPVEHYRDDEMHYVFRSALPLPKSEKLDGEGMIDRTKKVLLAYEAAFRELGDMTPEDSDFE